MDNNRDFQNDLEPRWVRAGCTILLLLFIAAIMLMCFISCKSSEFAHKHRFDKESHRMRHPDGNDYFLYHQPNCVY